MSPVASTADIPVGTFVMCTHDPEKCTLCQWKRSACGYYGSIGRIGVVIDSDDRRHAWAKVVTPTPQVKDPSIRVALLGHDRPSVIPMSQLDLVPNVTTDEMMWKWDQQLKDVHREGELLNQRLDKAADGTVEKRAVLDDMDRLSTRRLYIEKVFTVLIDGVEWEPLP